MPPTTQQATQYAQQQQWQQQQNIMGANIARSGEASRPSAVLSGAGNVTECRYGQGCYPVQPD